MSFRPENSSLSRPQPLSVLFLDYSSIIFCCKLINMFIMLSLYFSFYYVLLTLTLNELQSTNHLSTFISIVFTYISYVWVVVSLNCSFILIFLLFIHFNFPEKSSSIFTLQFRRHHQIWDFSASVKNHSLKEARRNLHEDWNSHLTSALWMRNLLTRFFHPSKTLIITRTIQSIGCIHANTVPTPVHNVAIWHVMFALTQARSRSNVLSAVNPSHKKAF